MVAALGSGARRWLQTTELNQLKFNPELGSWWCRGWRSFQFPLLFLVLNRYCARAPTQWEKHQARVYDERVASFSRQKRGSFSRTPCPGSETVSLTRTGSWTMEPWKPSERIVIRNTGRRGRGESDRKFRSPRSFSIGRIPAARGVRLAPFNRRLIGSRPSELDEIN